MSHLFSVLMVVMMGAVLAVLFLGLLSMAKGGPTNKKFSNKLMQARVILQAAALFFFVIALLVYKHN